MKLNFVKLAVAIYLGLFSQMLLANDVILPSNIDEAIIDDAIIDNNAVYPASFFAQYTPQNSMDMIHRLPGFSYNKGSDARGFGGNAGNVLINGVRPTSKSGGLTGALQRIPAAQVLYIEILRGGVGAGEAAGHSIVANIVKSNTSTNGTYSTTYTRASNGVAKPKIEATLTTKLREWDASFDLKIAGDPWYASALIENRDANENLTSSSYESRASVDEDFIINVEGSRKLGDGTLTINTALTANKWTASIDRDIFTASIPNSSSPDELWALHEEKKNFNTELGVDWVNTNDEWKWRIIGLASAHDYQYTNFLNSSMQGSDDGNSSEYFKDTLKTEYIARTTFGKVGEMSFKPEFGIEIANNRLDTELELIENSVAQGLEGADVIEEVRGEMFANFVYNTSPVLTIEGGLTVEVSEITVSGDSNQSQTFNFIKPRLSVNYNINEHSQLTLTAERTVEQLDFNDFAASAETSDSRTTSGNTNLKPESRSALTAIYNWSFSERGSFKLEAQYQRRRDIIEQITLPSGNQGLGNAGDADYWTVKTTLNLPVDNLLENGLFEIYHVYRGSDFIDPLTNSHRNLSNYSPNWLKVEFRQDVSQYGYAWGMEYWGGYKRKRFYVDEIRTFEGNKRLGKVFIETTRFFDIKSRLEIRHVNVGRFIRSRYLYQENRNGGYEGTEVSHRKFEPEINLSFSSTF